MYQKENNSKKPNLEYKIISTYDIPLIHAKIFVIDGKCAIMGSANFSENSFQNFAEYILVAKDDDLMVKKIEKVFQFLPNRSLFWKVSHLVVFLIKHL